MNAMTKAHEIKRTEAYGKKFRTIDAAKTVLSRPFLTRMGIRFALDR